VLSTNLNTCSITPQREDATMNARRLLNEGKWIKHDREWPHYEGEGPTYTEPTGRFQIKTYVTRTRSRKTRVWRLSLDGRSIGGFGNLTQALACWHRSKESVT